MNTQNLEGLGATILRVSLGVMFVAHGSLKIFVFTVAGTAGFLESQGFPAWLASPLIGAEVIGGALLIIGLQTRLVSIALIPILIGALIVHLPNGWMFSATGGGWEYPLFLIAASLTTALAGGGRFTISDHDFVINLLVKFTK